METMNIEIVNPQEKKLIQNLAKLDLIRIKKEKSKSEFVELLENFRRNSENSPSMDEITKEVESVRNARYAR